MVVSRLRAGGHKWVIRRFWMWRSLGVVRRLAMILLRIGAVAWRRLGGTTGRLARRRRVLCSRARHRNVRAHGRNVTDRLDAGRRSLRPNNRVGATGRRECSHRHDADHNDNSERRNKPQHTSCRRAQHPVARAHDVGGGGYDPVECSPQPPVETRAQRAVFTDRHSNFVLLYETTRWMLQVRSLFVGNPRSVHAAFQRPGATGHRQCARTRPAPRLSRGC
jgi:hypothetical protein